MTTAVVSQLNSTVDLVRRIAERFHPGSRTFPVEIFSFVDSQDGFGLTRGNGVSLVRGNVDGYQPSSWSLQFSSAIAFDILHRYEVEEWVNLQNRNSVLGTYYCAITPDRRLSGVIWETHVWSRLLDDISGMAGQGVVQWVSQILLECLQTSSDQALAFTAQFGGRVLEPTEKDLITLYVASDGTGQG